MERNQWQVNFEEIEQHLIDPNGMNIVDLIEEKEIARVEMLKAVENRNGNTFAIQIEKDAPALSYQANFWNFWNVVKELRVVFGIQHRSTGAVYE